MTAFLQAAGEDAVVVVDVRNPDFAKEPGDEASVAAAGLPGMPGRTGGRSFRSVNVVFDRETRSMAWQGKLAPLLEKTGNGEGSGKDTPIITHCGGGGRGQKAREFLEKEGFTNVINGGGPAVEPLWAMYRGL